MDEDDSLPRLDKKQFVVEDMTSAANDLEYWLGRSVEDRFLAIEQSRQLLYGYDSKTPPRLQRVFEIIDRE